MQKELEMALATTPYPPRYLKLLTGVSFALCDLSKWTVHLKAYEKEVKFRLHKQ